MSVIGVMTEQSVIAGGVNIKRASKFTAGSSFTATWMGFLAAAGFGTDEKARLGIYSDNSGEPDALLGYTAEIRGKGAKAQLYANLVASVSISNSTDYWLALIEDSVGGM